MAQTATTKKRQTPRKKNTAPAKASAVRVKTGKDVLAALDNFLSHNLHTRFSVQLSKNLQKRLVAYGPWLSTLLVLVVLPELMTLAKNGSLITFTGFFDTIFFNQESWVLLLVMLANLMLLVDGLSHIFTKARRGWNRVYLATLVATGYIIWQLFSNLAAPAPAILSLLAIGAILFSLLDIRDYYQ